jgi:hypothetical protein
MHGFELIKLFFRNDALPNGKYLRFGKALCVQLQDISRRF